MADEKDTTEAPVQPVQPVQDPTPRIPNFRKAVPIFQDQQNAQNQPKNQRR